MAERMAILPPSLAIQRRSLRLSGAVVASVLIHIGVVWAAWRVGIGVLRPVRLTDSPAPATKLDLGLVVEQASPRVPEPHPEPVPVKPTPRPEPVAQAPVVRTVSTALASEPAPVLRSAVAPVPAVKLIKGRERVEPAGASPPEPVRATVSGPASVTFASVDAPRASRVVYVLDASGAMTGALPLVKDELVRSVSRLDALQRFEVIVFRMPLGGEGDGVASFAGGLAPATEENKARLAAWLERIGPSGASDPLPGLRRAMALHPGLVMLLTRSIPRTGTSWGSGPEATLAEMDGLNPPNPFTGQRPTILRAVQFIDDDPTGLLPALAARHGDGEGSYRVIRLDELHRD